VRSPRRADARARHAETAIVQLFEQDAVAWNLLGTTGMVGDAAGRATARSDGCEEAAMGDRHQAAELRWILRPATTRPARVRALAGQPVHAVGPVGPDGETEVVLGDGTRVHATRAEIVAERPSPRER
jgi:hypothetical protein